MNAAIVSLLVIVGALAAMLGGAAVVIRIMSGWIIDAANRYRLNVLEYAQKIADEKAQKTAPKPDPAKECGVVPPKFDAERRPRNVAPASLGGLDRKESPRRKEKHKVVVVFSHGAQKYYNLEDFYRREDARKEWISPKVGMVEPERLRIIAKNILGHFAQRGLFAHKVCLFRNGFWHNFEACNDHNGLLTARRIEP